MPNQKTRFHVGLDNPQLKAAQFPRLGVDTVEQQVQQTGSYSPLEWLLESGLLPYSAYEQWRQGNLKHLEDAIQADVADWRAWLREGEAHAKALGPGCCRRICPSETRRKRCAHTFRKWAHRLERSNENCRDHRDDDQNAQQENDPLPEPVDDDPRLGLGHSRRRPGRSEVPRRRVQRLHRQWAMGNPSRTTTPSSRADWRGRLPAAHW